MGRLGLHDTKMSALVKMSDGNPGAAVAITEIMTQHSSIDPQSALGGLGVLLSFDDMGIYGTDIYVLYSDKCGRDVRKLLMLMRSHQLGFISSSKIIEMAKDQMRKIDLTEEEYADLDKKVCKQLEEFKRAS